MKPIFLRNSQHEVNKDTHINRIETLVEVVTPFNQGRPSCSRQPTLPRTSGTIECSHYFSGINTLELFGSANPGRCGYGQFMPIEHLSAEGLGFTGSTPLTKEGFSWEIASSTTENLRMLNIKDISCSHSGPNVALKGDSASYEMPNQKLKGANVVWPFGNKGIIF
jgi:hypothetical protein